MRSDGVSETITVTPSQAFGSENEGWGAVGELNVGDRIASYNCSTITLSKCRTAARKHDTNNFEVADYHTYFVGETSALVHNSCKILRLGDGFETTAEMFHGPGGIKQAILLQVKRFEGRVGGNPDIEVIGGKILLKGTGLFKGKSFDTDLNASDFF